MAKKVILKNKSDEQILPMTKLECVIDLTLATTVNDGLMSPQDKMFLDELIADYSGETVKITYNKVGGSDSDVSLLTVFIKDETMDIIDSFDINLDEELELIIPSKIKYHIEALSSNPNFTCQSSSEYTAQPNNTRTISLNATYSAVGGVTIELKDGTEVTVASYAANPSNPANAIKVSDGMNIVKLALNDVDSSAYSWGSETTDIATLENITSTGAAYTDFTGNNSTNTIVSAVGEEHAAAKVAQTYIFENYKQGYLPSAGEMNLVNSNLTKVNEALTKVGGTALSTSTPYWTSSENGETTAWSVKMGTSGVKTNNKTTQNLVRPCCSTTAASKSITIIRNYTPEDAILKINGETIEGNTFKGNLGGEYTYSVEKQSYTPLTGSFTILPTTESITISGELGNKYVTGGQLVDLGLPSGTLWASCNLGANSEEEAGLYFQWGDTEGYTAEEVGVLKTFDWSTYKYCQGSETTMTKYCTNSSYGTVDNKTVLEEMDDAVIAHMGLTTGNQMPTQADIEELINGTNKSSAVINGVSGTKFASKTDASKYIFIPYFGRAYSRSVLNSGSNASVWSSSLNTSSPYGACYLLARSGTASYNSDNRCYGFSIRGVWKRPKYQTSLEYVDLGLGLLWAKCNIGSGVEEGSGLYFQWADTNGYSAEEFGVNKVFDYNTCPYQTNASAGPYSSDTKFTKYLGSTSSSYKDSSATNENALKTVLDPEDDAAHVHMGGNWRMPTLEEITELVNGTNKSSAVINEVSGTKLASKTDASKYIFIPYVGLANSSSVVNSGSDAFVWSSSLDASSPYGASNLRALMGTAFNSNGYNNSSYRSYGFSVRGVHPKYETSTEYVDLGLPSGLKWAKCNVGAMNEYETGRYFQWGDISGYTAEEVGVKKVFDYNTTPYQTNASAGTSYSDTKFTKYLGSTSSSYKDSSATNENALKTVLDPEDDAAHVHMGGNWRMPTLAEITELINGTNKSLAVINGVSGTKFASKTDASKYIFIPYVGNAFSHSVVYSGSYAYVWSSSLYTSTPYNAYYLYASSGTANYNYYNGNYYRCYGVSVRGVLSI